ncbi:hypothetical protein BKA65DRAFT_558798 [Rhexocercosporidium sp. MPI-PUGE-AT-0058]|nr:hypothetical protein BKA65DRAFT_558798 [Rhexocercosporidium sp. MPI-PUGE-AT-0058]
MEKQTYTREEYVHQAPINQRSESPSANSSIRFILQQQYCTHQKRRAIFISVLLTLAVIMFIGLAISFLDICAKKPRNDRTLESNAQLFQLVDRNLYIRRNERLVRLVPADEEEGGAFGRRWSWWLKRCGPHDTRASEETRVGSVILRDETEVQAQRRPEESVLGREERGGYFCAYGRSGKDITDRQWTWEGRNGRGA